MIVVGAGLSGLTAAVELAGAGLSVLVLEASDRPGGRIRSIHDPVDGTYLGDLGPTWVWPPYQPVVAAWLERLNLATFEQFDSGQGVVQTAPDQPVIHQLIPGQYGMCRIVGGPQALIDGLLGRLPQGVLRLNAQVTAIHADEDGLTVETSSGLQSVFHAGQVVIALPPRLIAERLRIVPEPEPVLMTALAQTPTWMATQAKVVFMFDEPFWREQNLSGRVASRVGPCVEIHDHCSPDGGKALLFGFVGLPHELRAQHADVLEDALLAQLTHCFGPRAAKPLRMHIEDWARNRDICSEQDRQTDPAHPEVMDDLARAPLLDGRLLLAGAETSTISPGLIEGALNAGSAAAKAVTRLRSRRR